MTRCAGLGETAVGGSFAVRYDGCPGARMPRQAARWGAGWAMTGCGLAGGTDDGCGDRVVTARMPAAAAPNRPSRARCTARGAGGGDGSSCADGAAATAAVVYSGGTPGKWRRIDAGDRSPGGTAFGGGIVVSAAGGGRSPGVACPGQVFPGTNGHRYVA